MNNKVFLSTILDDENINIDRVMGKSVINLKKNRDLINKTKSRAKYSRKFTKLMSALLSFPTSIVWCLILLMVFDNLSPFKKIQTCNCDSQQFVYLEFSAIAFLANSMKNNAHSRENNFQLFVVYLASLRIIGYEIKWLNIDYLESEFFEMFWFEDECWMHLNLWTFWRLSSSHSF